jgi:DNA-binding NarL/FixJ family response regulator
MTEQTKIVIADDHPIFRAELRQVVESDRMFRVVGESSDVATALDETEVIFADPEPPLSTL